MQDFTNELIDAVMDFIPDKDAATLIIEHSNFIENKKDVSFFNKLIEIVPELKEVKGIYQRKIFIQNNFVKIGEMKSTGESNRRVKCLCGSSLRKYHTIEKIGSNECFNIGNDCLSKYYMNHLNQKFKLIEEKNKSGTIKRKKKCVITRDLIYVDADITGRKTYTATVKRTPSKINSNWVSFEVPDPSLEFVKKAFGLNKTIKTKNSKYITNEKGVIKYYTLSDKMYIQIYKGENKIKKILANQEVDLTFDINSKGYINIQKVDFFKKKMTLKNDYI